MQEQERNLYVVFSATPYRMGGLIRWATGERYNHVSIGTKEDLSSLYSFARRYYRTPFYGGFVTERPCRYRKGGAIANIEICRLPLTEAQESRLHSLLRDMRKQPERYLYNHLSALTAPLHVKIAVRDAFTCTEFAVKVLSTLGFPFDSRRFYTIGGLARRLDDFRIYTGDFPEASGWDAAYYAPRPLRYPFLSSTHSILRLLWRKASFG